MPKHADAMRHVFWRLLQEIVGVDGICADDFIGGDADTKVVVVRVAGKGGDDNMLRQKAGTSAFGQGNVDQWNNHAAQIEDANEIGRGERQLGDQRPVQDFFDVEHRKAEAFAATAEDAVLRLGRRLFERAEGFEQIGAVGVGG